jgi:hypothetical protein
MILHLKFNDETMIPHLIFQLDRKSYELKNIRWIQFIALLAYRRLSGDKNGFVTLEDIQQLRAFNRVNLRQIGKYLSNSSAESPPTMRKFIRNHLWINTLGPYELNLAPDRIITHQSNLKTYIDSITSLVLPPSTSLEVIWDTAQETFQRYELISSRKLFEAYINAGKTCKDIPVDQLILAYIRLLEIERAEFDNLPSYIKISSLVRKRCSEEKTSSKLRLLLSLLLSLEALGIDPDDQTIQLIINLSLKATELAKTVQGSNPDKFYLMAGNEYHRYHISLRYGTPDMSKDALKRTIQLYSRMQEAGPTRFVSQEPGVIEGIQLQSRMIQCVNASGSAEHEELAWYKKLLKEGGASRLVTLSIAEWIRHSFLKKRRFDDALEFTDECLIAHADLHETAIFRRLRTENRRLKQLLR